MGFRQVNEVAVIGRQGIPLVIHLAPKRGAFQRRVIPQIKVVADICILGDIGICGFRCTRCGATIHPPIPDGASVTCPSTEVPAVFHIADKLHHANCSGRLHAPAVDYIPSAAFHDVAEDVPGDCVVDHGFSSQDIVELPPDAGGLILLVTRSPLHRERFAQRSILDSAGPRVAVQHAYAAAVGVRISGLRRSQIGRNRGAHLRVLLHVRL